jgi:hypothetical protein
MNGYGELDNSIYWKGRAHLGRNESEKKIISGFGVHNEGVHHIAFAWGVLLSLFFSSNTLRYDTLLGEKKPTNHTFFVIY